MKLKVSAKLPDDMHSYKVLKTALLQLFPGAKLRESGKNPPYKVLHLTIGKSIKSKNIDEFEGES